MKLFALSVAVLWACGASAAELPSRGEKTKAAEPRAPECFIAGERGFATAGGGCVRVSGYVSVGVSGGNLKH